MSISESKELDPFYYKFNKHKNGKEKIRSKMLIKNMWVLQPNNLIS